MTSSRPLRPDTALSRSTLGPAPAGGSGRGIALIALAIAVVALGLAAWRTLVPSGSPCQETAWTVTPLAKDLPSGWTIATSQYDVERKSMSILGPLPADGTVAQAVVYATITCYPTGAADAVVRSADAATAAGQLVTDRRDLGEQGFTAIAESGAVFLQFRHDAIVVYLAASAEATERAVDELASAFDIALGGDGGAVAIGTGDVPTPAETVAPEPTEPDPTAVGSPGPAADLQAMLPAKVGTVALTIDRATGDMVLGEDQGSRAISAAIRAAGRQPTDLLVAQAYDETSESDLSILAITVAGMDVAKVRVMVLQSWLSSTGIGVTTTTATVGGRTVSRVDYGDEGAMDYVFVAKGVVFVVTTADPALAATAVAALP